jgi:uncharacterized protein YfiM (DUF2279 family)
MSFGKSMKWLPQLRFLSPWSGRTKTSRAPFRTARPELEHLEDRQVPSAASAPTPITDMTQLAKMFPTHSAPTILYLNFGGTGSNSAAIGETVAAYTAKPGADRASDMAMITDDVASIFSAFRLEVVAVDQAGWYDHTSQGNTTIFIGAIASDVDSTGMKTPHSFTPSAYVDAPGIGNPNGGTSHKPNSDPFDLAFVDPVGAISKGTATVEDTAGIADSIAHEAGHTFGLEHVLTGDPSLPDIMSYDEPNQQVINDTFAVTDFNYDPSHKDPMTGKSEPLYHAGDALFAEWKLADGTIDKITTQNSYTYLATVLGRKSQATIAPGATPNGYTFSTDNTQHIVFLGTDGKIYEDWFSTIDSTWRQNNLFDPQTGAHNGVTALPAGLQAAGNPIGYQYGSTQQVVFRGYDGHVYDLSFTQQTGWSWTDLFNSQTGAHNGATGLPRGLQAVGDPTCYQYSVDNTQHVVFTGSDGAIYELWNGPTTGWGWNDLFNSQTGAHNGTTGLPSGLHAVGNPTGYQYTVDNTQHVFFRGSDGHLYELWFSPKTGWGWNDLFNSTTGAHNGLAGLPYGLLAAGDPCCYQYTVDNTQHVFFTGNNGHIYELWFSPQTGWGWNDLFSAQTGAHNGVTGLPAGLQAIGKPTCYQYSGDNSQHVDFLGSDGHIYELWFLPSSGWHWNDLTEATGAPLAASAPSGYQWGGAQHVIYQGKDGHVHELWFLDGTWHDNDLSWSVVA